MLEQEIRIPDDDDDDFTNVWSMIFGNYLQYSIEI